MLFQNQKVSKGLSLKGFLLILFATFITFILVIDFNKFLLATSYIPYSTYLHQTEAKTKNPQPLYYGVGVDMSQLLPGSQHYVKNSRGEDLIDLASKMGINMFRITNATPAFKTGNASYTKTQWGLVLNKMQRRGIKAVILIESPTIYQKYITPSYLPFVKQYIVDSGVLDHSNVYGIDLYNEVVINSTSNLAQLKTAAHMIKNKYPKAKLTLGWWAIDTFKKDDKNKEVYLWNDYAAGKTLDSFTDFYAIHMYGFDKPILGKYPDPYLFTEDFLTEVKIGLQTKKPILIEEFGAANGSIISDQDTLGSPQLQANTYQGVYQFLTDSKDPQIIGTTAYQFNSRSKGPDAWAIIKNNGDYLYPATVVLKNYATGEKIKN